MKPTTLYRLYDERMRLLYVGIAGNPGRRFEQHAGDKPWWGDVAHVRTEHFDTRGDAERAEREAIRDEHPLYNIVHRKSDPAQKVVVRVERIQVICAACGTPIPDEDGYLEVDQSAACAAERAWEEYDHRQHARGGTRVISGDGWTELFNLPKRVEWKAWHRRCDPAPELGTYWIAVERLHTWNEIVDWTAHLQEKGWASHTTWFDLVRSLAHGTSKTLRLIVVEEAR